MKLKLYATCVLISLLFSFSNAFSQACSPASLIGGTTTIGINPVCPGSFANMAVSGSTTGTGLTYQWESSPDNVNWTAINSATLAFFSTVQTNLYYRRKMICSNGGAVAYSSSLRADTKDYLTCYCNSSATCNSAYQITNVSCGTLNNSSGCSAGGYTNYSGNVAAPNIMQGIYLPVSVTVGAGNNSRTVDCYIDFDHSGSYQTNELTTLSLTSGNLYSGIIKVPYHAATGIARMHVVFSQFTTGSVCSPSGYAEVEDYYVNITANNTGSNGFVLFVKPATPGSDNSGTSWANALSNVAKALQIATTGDTIKVAKGIYYTGAGYTNGFALKDSIVLLGGYPDTGTPTDADRNATINTTVLSGYQSAGTTNANYHVLYASGAMPACLVDGFVLQNGGYFNGEAQNSPTRKGGGLYAEEGANLTLRNCIFRNNYTEVAGTAMAINQASPIFYNCIITGNTNQNINLGPYYTNIILAERNSSPVFYNLLMAGNKAITLLHTDSSSITFKNSTIVKNSLQTGIINGVNLSNLTFHNSILYYNTTYNNNYQSIIYDTADIKLSTGAAATLTNCITQRYNQGTNVLTGSLPKFRDTSNLAGPDGFFYTADDGLFLSNPCSPGINTGANTLLNGLGTDITGFARTIEGNVDIGAYETQQPRAAIPTTVYVRANATGLNDGSSWDNAFKDLHRALQACSDTIKVAAGNYAPLLAGNQPYWLENKRVILGGYPNNGNPTNTDRDYALYPTNITGTTTTAAKADMIIRGQQLDSTSVLDGLTFTDAGQATLTTNPPGLLFYSSCNNPIIRNCLFTTNYSTLYEGKKNINPLFLNCRFYNNYYSNSTYFLGLMLFRNNERTTLKNCVFEKNPLPGIASAGIILSAESSPLILDSCNFIRNKGVAMDNKYSNSIITACSFINNSSTDITNSYSNPIFNNCVFQDSIIQFASTPLMINSISNPIITDCQFSNGTGAVYNDSSSAQFTRCIFSNCQSTFYNKRNSNMVLNNCISTGSNYYTQYNGSFMHNIGSSPIINNCVIANSKGGPYGVINNDAASYLQVNNTIFWKNFINGSVYQTNRIDIKDFAAGHTIARNSSFEFFNGGTANNNTTGIDPRFLNVLNAIGPDSTWLTADDGLQLCNCSPAINTGNNTYIAGTADVTGNSRIFNTTVDRGAYELQSIPVAVPNTYYVNASAAGNNTGENWNNAYTSLHSALANPCGDTIKIAAGLYKPSIQNRDSLFTINRSMAVIGSYNPANPNTERDADVNPTIISGDIGTLNDSLDNSRSLILLDNTDSVLLDGLVVKDANDNSNNGNSKSALMANYAINLEIANSRFYNNTTAYGKGAAMSLPYIQKCKLTKTVIRKNRGYSAGGMYIDNWGQTEMKNCVFDSNYSVNYGGGVYLDGSGSTLSNSATFTNCLFNANTAMFYGGGLYNTASIVFLNNCTFHNNRIPTAGTNPNQPRLGAGIVTSKGLQGFVVNNCIFTNNSYLNQPGQQTTFLDIAPYLNGNSPSAGVADVLVRNTAKTTPSNLGGNNITPAGIRYKDTTSPIGPDNRWFTADDGLQLTLCSDGIDKGLNSANTNPTDLAGRPRVFNSIVDMGPYEFSGAPAGTPLLTTPNDSLIANKELTAADGWTHYYKDCYYLMSVKKAGQNIGTIGDGTFSVKIKTLPTYGSNTATDLSVANYISPGVSWKVMNRYWKINTTAQLTDSIQVRFPYAATDFNDIRGANPAITTQQQMVFYKTDGPANPTDLTITAADFHKYLHGTNPSKSKWTFTAIDTVNNIASFFVKNLNGGGGGGTMDTTCVSNTSIWLGLTPAWNNGSNWSTGQVPTVCTHAIVNIGVAFMPEVNIPNAACYLLTLNPGTTITIRAGANLSIIGQ